MPNCLMSTPGLDGQHEEREHQDQRGARDELAGPGKPERDRGVRVARLVVGLAHAGEHEDLVVHREAEQEREDHQRDPRDDRLRRVDVPDRLEPWPCWKMKTMIPYAAPSETRFSMTAFSGSSSERKARASKR